MSFRSQLKIISICYLLYLAGIATYLLVISDFFAMNTYFSDNSLLPGLANREFSLQIEAEYYLKQMEKIVKDSNAPAMHPDVARLISRELDNFGLEPYEQSFHHFAEGEQFNGTNIYTIIRGERSTSSEAIVLCAPFRVKSSDNSNTLPGIALTLALAKYFSTKSYWAKDVVILFVDHEEYGASAWLDSYYDVHKLSQDVVESGSDSLIHRSGPLQAAIILELYGRKFSRVNLKIQGNYGQLPNLDLFNLAIELSTRESVTPYFYNRSMPFDLTVGELFEHHLDTVLSFMRAQASMNSDGLHGLFLKYSAQSLTLEGPKEALDGRNVITASMLNVGRLLEGLFRSLNNLTERFNRSYYFYIILSIRRFTSIGYYMIPFCMIISPTLIKALNKPRTPVVHLASALLLSLVSTINISAAMLAALVLVPFLILF